jgi:predicted nucleotidyltransferase component of viral defense system
MQTLNKILLEDTALVYNFDDVEFVNKDYYVVELLKALQDLPKDGFHFVFAGGTCLSKAFTLTKRMSEDADLRVVFETHPASRNVLKKKLSRVKHLLEDNLRELFPGSTLKLAGNENRYLEFEVPYPRASKNSTLREDIKLDVAYFQLILPPVLRQVSSFISKIKKDAPEIEGILCIDPLETLADKMVALPRRICTAKEKQEELDRNIVRHIYDIYSIYPAIDAAKIKDLVQQIIERDRIEYHGKNPAWAGDPRTNTFEALEELKKSEFATLFATYAQVMVYDQNLPDFQIMLDFVIDKIAEAIG